MSDSSQVNKTSRMNKATVVWRFEDAPPELRKLSSHGGDEDWLLLFPPGIDPDETTWACSDGEIFGDWCNSRQTLPDGHTVIIAAHA